MTSKVLYVSNIYDYINDWKVLCGSINSFINMYNSIRFMPVDRAEI